MGILLNRLGHKLRGKPQDKIRYELDKAHRLDIKSSMWAQLTPDQTVEVLELHRKGIGNTEIAKQFGVSRQTIYKYIYNAEHFSKDPDFTMRMNFMNGQQLCTVIDIDFKHEIVRMKNYTDRIPLRAFGVVENPSWADFEEFLKERCLPASRAGLKGILREMDVPFYDPLLIIEKTNGRMAGDHQWVQMIRNIAA